MSLTDTFAYLNKRPSATRVPDPTDRFVDLTSFWGATGGRTKNPTTLCHNNVGVGNNFAFKGENLRRVLGGLPTRRNQPTNHIQPMGGRVKTEATLS